MSLKNTQNKTTSHSKYNINYHIVFCHNYGYDLIEQEIMPDHVHIFVSAPPTIAPVDIVRKLKSISANWIFQGFPTLKQSKFLGSGLWGVADIILELLEL